MAYDVFISFKNTAAGGGLTVDRTIAERLYMMLRDEGLEVFFSERDLSTTAFMDEIYQALDEARLLILVGTSVEYINSEWVKSEWSTFFGSMKSGRKPDGHILTVLQGITTRDLPIQLEHFESFGANRLESAVDFAFRTLEKVKRSEAAARVAEELELRRKEAEDAAVKEMQKRMEAERRAEKAGKSGGRRGWKIALVVLLCLGVLAGGTLLVLDRLEASRLQAMELGKVPITEADRALAEIYDFKPTENGFAITKYNGRGGKVFLPSEYNGKPVTVIGSSAFAYKDTVNSVVIPDSVTTIDSSAFSLCSELVSVTIPEGVTTIGGWAFNSCEKLTVIKLPDSLTTIGDFAFSECTGLGSIAIPDSVSELGTNVFYRCENLKTVDFSDDNRYFRFENGVIFNRSGSTLHEALPCLSGSYNVPVGVVKITNYAFAACENLTEVIIPKGVTEIAAGTFENCSALEDITIPEGVTAIGARAFAGCGKLSYISIPDSVTSIGISAFAECVIVVTAPHVASYYGYTPEDMVMWIDE